MASLNEVMRPPKRPRPYWHVDAKWISGLLLLVALSLTLFVNSLAAMTVEEPAVETISMTMALLTSRNGLDDETEIAAFRQQLQQSPDRVFQPFPGLPVTIREADLVGVAPRELRLRLWRQFARPLYRDGAEGLAAQIEDPEMAAGLSAGVGPLALFSLEAHETLRTARNLLALVCLLLLALLVLFSFRFGRLVSPGVVMAAAALPGWLVVTLLGLAAQREMSSTPPGEEAGITGMANYLAGHLLPLLIPHAKGLYGLCLMAGLILIGGAVVGSLIWRLARPARR